MKTYPEILRLNQAIHDLEVKQNEELAELRVVATDLYTQIKPSNLIRKTLQGLLSPQGEQSELPKLLFGMAGGYLSKLVVQGKSTNPLRVLLGNALQVSVGILVAEHSDTIRAIGTKLIAFIRSKQVSPDQIDESAGDQVNPA